MEFFYEIYDTERLSGGFVVFARPIIFFTL